MVIDLDRGGEAQGRAERLANARAAVISTPVLESDSDPELAAALAGELTAGAERRGRQAAEAAARLAGEGDCVQAEPAARSAALELAAARALGIDVTADLSRAHAALLVCADAAGKTGEALQHAQMLRALGHDAAPPGIQGATWSRYPEIDAAANVARAEVEIATDVAGAEIWVDYERRDTAPATLYLEQGEHVVVARAGGAVAAKRIAVTGWSHAVSLSPQPAGGRWARLDALIDELRAGRRAADAAAMAEVMRAAGAGFALVLTGGGVVEAWAARAVGDAELLGRRRATSQAAALLAQAARPARAPDPDRPLLRETQAERQARQEEASRPTQWWVYAAVIGAAALGAGIIVLGDTGEDRQRFEITLP